MLYGLSLSFLYQRDKEAVLLWIAGIIPLESLYSISPCRARYYSDYSTNNCTSLVAAIYSGTFVENKGVDCRLNELSDWKSHMLILSVYQVEPVVHNWRAGQGANARIVFNDLCRQEAAGDIVFDKLFHGADLRGIVNLFGHGTLGGFQLPLNSFGQLIGFVRQNQRKL